MLKIRRTIHRFAKNETEANYCWEVNSKSQYEDKLFAYGLDEKLQISHDLQPYGGTGVVASALALYSRAVN